MLEIDTHLDNDQISWHQVILMTCLSIRLRTFLMKVELSSCESLRRLLIREMRSNCERCLRSPVSAHVWKLGLCNNCCFCCCHTLVLLGIFSIATNLSTLSFSNFRPLPILARWDNTLSGHKLLLIDDKDDVSSSSSALPKTPYTTCFTTSFTQSTKAFIMCQKQKSFI